jgi:prepilin-type N-terminal cleavage/methylation domain-containing protein
MSENERRDRRVPDPGQGRRRAVLRRGRCLGRRDQRGLTLVELMIVVTIIAIIAGVAVAVYQDIIKKSKLAADQAVVSSLRSAVAIYYGKNNGIFPGSPATVNSLVTPSPIWNCTITPTYDSSNGKLTFTAVLSDCP